MSSEACRRSEESCPFRNVCRSGAPGEPGRPMLLLDEKSLCSFVSFFLSLSFSCSFCVPKANGWENSLHGKVNGEAISRLHRMSCNQQTHKSIVVAIGRRMMV